VAAASATAADLVRACAFLAPDAIPEEIFSEGGNAFGEPLSTLAESKLALTKAIAEAARFSLISRNPQTKTLTIHRLVQEVLRSEMDEDSQRQWAEQVVEAVTAVFPNAEFENWEQCDRLIAQAQATTDLITVYGFTSEIAALLLNRTGYYYNSQGRYEEAEPLYLDALAMMKRLLGEAHPDVATSLNNLAGLYESQGRYKEAEPLLLEALTMRKQLLGEAHPAVASSLFNLGALRYNQGRYSEAQTLLLQAQPIYLSQLGPDHPNTQELQSWIDTTQAALDSEPP
jgi:tetratricopeptide (TPR) repeat protein